MKVKNLTKGEILIYDQGELKQTYEACSTPVEGKVTLVSKASEIFDGEFNIPLVEEVYSAPGMPEPEADTIFIVDNFTFKALKASRKDIITPAKMYRSYGGQILGVISFIN